MDSIIGDKPTSRPSNLVSSLPLQLGSESWLIPNSPTSANLGQDEDKEQQSKELYEDDSAFGKSLPLIIIDSNVINTPSPNAEHFLDLGSSVTIGTSSGNKLPHFADKERQNGEAIREPQVQEKFFSVSQIKKGSEILQK